jgi:hypothetical protein
MCYFGLLWICVQPCPRHQSTHEASVWVSCGVESGMAARDVDVVSLNAEAARRSGASAFYRRIAVTLRECAAM